MKEIIEGQQNQMKNNRFRQNCINDPVGGRHGGNHSQHSCCSDGQNWRAARVGGCVRCATSGDFEVSIRSAFALIIRVLRLIAEMRKNLFIRPLLSWCGKEWLFSLKSC